MRRAILVLAVILSTLGTLAGLAFWPRAAKRAFGPLHHAAVVDLRDWRATPTDSVGEIAPRLERLAPLGAEVIWENGRPRVALARVDWGALGRAGTPVAPVLRVRSFDGDPAPSFASGALMRRLAMGLVLEARRAGLEPASLVVDAEVALSRIESFRLWVESVSADLAPVRLVLVVSPEWVGHPGFGALARTAGEFLLRVERDVGDVRDAGFRPLFSPSEARQLVERAAEAGVPFHAVLPTRGYVLALDPAGAWLGRSDQGVLLSWPRDASLVELRPAEEDAADLLDGWIADRPELLHGIVWDGLPVGDPGAVSWSLDSWLDVVEGRRVSAEGGGTSSNRIRVR
jgi:hypothetical protein